MDQEGDNDPAPNKRRKYNFWLNPADLDCPASPSIPRTTSWRLEKKEQESELETGVILGHDPIEHGNAETSGAAHDNVDDTDSSDQESETSADQTLEEESDSRTSNDSTEMKSEREESLSSSDEPSAQAESSQDSSSAEEDSQHSYRYQSERDESSQDSVNSDLREFSIAHADFERDKSDIEHTADNQAHWIGRNTYSGTSSDEEGSQHPYHHQPEHDEPSQDSVHSDLREFSSAHADHTEHTPNNQSSRTGCETYSGASSAEGDSQHSFHQQSEQNESVHLDGDSSDTSSNTVHSGAFRNGTLRVASNEPGVNVAHQNDEFHDEEIFFYEPQSEQEVDDRPNVIYDDSDLSEEEEEEEDVNPIPTDHHRDNPIQTEMPQATGFQTLREKLQQSFKQPILEQPKASRGEVLLNSLVYSQKHSLNFSAQAGLMQLINSIFQADIVPSTKYHLDKLFSSSVGVHYHFYCEHCFQYLSKRKNNEKGQKSIVCPVCNVESQISDLNTASFFVTLDLPGQLELILNDPEVLASGIMNPADVLNREDEVMTDLYDGKMYRKYAASLDFTDFQHVSFCFSDDGTPLFRSSNFSVWVIFVSVLELPPLLRFSKLLLGALWFGKHPKQDLFLKPLIDHTQKLSEEGFTIVWSGKETKIKGHLLCCCADAPARAAIQCIHQFNGECGCNWCIHPGETLENTRNVRVYPFLDDIPPRRTKKEVFEDGVKALEKGQKNYHVNGVLGVSPILVSKTCDIVDGMIVEPLHVTARGVPSQLTGAWFGADGSDVPYYIGEPLSVQKIEHLLKKIKPPIEARRFPRSIADMSFWKARDFENWLLYYSLPILTHFNSVLVSDEDTVCDPMPSRYIKHWAKLVEALHLITQSTISYDDINQAHVLITEFVFEVEELYSKKHMTYNVHILLHLCENVVRWGPTWSISAYCFEDWNGVLKKLIHANKGIASQVLRGIFHEYAIRIMQTEVGSSSTQKFEENLHKKKIKSYMRVDNCTVLGKCSAFVPSESEKFICDEEGLEAEDFVECTRIVKLKCVYAGQKDKRGVSEKKSNNSSAVLLSGEKIYIRKIIASLSKNKCFFIASKIYCQPFCYKPNRLLNVALNFVNFVGEEIKLVPVSEVKTICARIILSETEDYIVNVPNLYNVN